MPYTKVCIHYVWATKYRKPMLTSSLRNGLFAHIRENARSKKIHIDRLNGHLDHVHCLIWLKPTQTIDEIAKLLKGESAHWFNNRSEIQDVKLQWQSDYFAISVSESIVPRVRAYIDNQEAHHRKKTFAEEYNEFMERYDFNAALQSRD